MLPTPKNYAIYPSVVPADTKVQMTIAPLEKAFLLFEGRQYSITVIAINADEPWYHSPTIHKKLTATAADGVLRFEYTFEGEQEYTVLLEYEDKKLQELAVYSLYEDLYRRSPLKGDLHSHSHRSDGRRDPSALAGHFREQGYDFFALTDHNRYYPGSEIDETFDGVKLAFCRVKGEELHAPGCTIHIINVGSRYSVAEKYINQRAEYDAEVAQLEAQLSDDIPEQYRSRYARCLWVTQKIHEAGGLAIFPHPYWQPGKSKTYNVSDEFSVILLKSGMFDAYELIGGMTYDGCNRSVALWAELRAQGLDISVVGSSDVHGIERSPHFPGNFTICFADGNDNDSIIDAIRDGYSVAVEMTGVEYERQHRCYGSLRLVSYAQFLLKNYFPEATRICQGEGAAMRSYAMGLADAQLIEVQAEYSLAHRARYFGKQPPILPSKEILDFEQKWREIQLSGPVSKGSLVDTKNVSRQI